MLFRENLEKPREKFLVRLIRCAFGTLLLQSVLLLSCGGSEANLCPLLPKAESTSIFGEAVHGHSRGPPWRGLSVFGRVAGERLVSQCVWSKRVTIGGCVGFGSCGTNATRLLTVGLFEAEDVQFEADLEAFKADFLGVNGETVGEARLETTFFRVSRPGQGEIQEFLDSFSGTAFLVTRSDHEYLVVSVNFEEGVEPLRQQSAAISERFLDLIESTSGESTK